MRLVVFTALLLTSVHGLSFTWATKGAVGPISTSDTRYHGSVTVGGLMYVFGYDGLLDRDLVYTYEEATDTWSKIYDAPAVHTEAGTSNCATARIGGRPTLLLDNNTVMLQMVFEAPEDCSLSCQIHRVINYDIYGTGSYQDHAYVELVKYTIADNAFDVGAKIAVFSYGNYHTAVMAASFIPIEGPNSTVLVLYYQTDLCPCSNYYSYNIDMAVVDTGVGVFGDIIVSGIVVGSGTDAFRPRLKTFPGSLRVSDIPARIVAIGEYVYQFGTCVTIENSQFNVSGGYLCDSTCGVSTSLFAGRIANMTTSPYEAWENAPYEGIRPSLLPFATEMVKFGSNLILGSSGEYESSTCRFYVYVPATNQMEIVEDSSRTCSAFTKVDGDPNPTQTFGIVNGKLVVHTFEAGTTFVATITCNPGMYRKEDGTCEVCPAGTYSDRDDMDECLPCADAGGPCPALGSTGPLTLCEEGYGVTSGPYATGCTACPPSTYSPEGSGRCLDCPPGQIQPFRLQDECVPCRNGTIVSKDKLACLECPPGRYSGYPTQFVAGDAYCADCPAGTAAPLSGSAACTPCVPGFASPGRALVCTACEAGTASTADGSACLACPPGTVSGLASSNCSSCPAGSAPNELQSDCVECPAGFFSSGTGCSPCPPGSFAPTAGSFSCQLCRPGTFTNSSGLSECSECRPPTEYQPASGSTSCLSCEDLAPGSEVSAVGASDPTDCACQGNNYPTPAGCVRCPTGAICAAGQQPVAAPGYYDANPANSTFIKCKYAPACVGGNQTCADGYEGFLCGNCIDGFYKSNGACEECPEGGTLWWIWIPPFIFMLLVVAFFFVIGAFRTKMRMKEAANDMKLHLLATGKLASSTKSRVSSTDVVIESEDTFDATSSFASGSWNPSSAAESEDVEDLQEESSEGTHESTEEEASVDESDDDVKAKAARKRDSKITIMGAANLNTRQPQDGSLEEDGGDGGGFNAMETGDALLDFLRAMPNVPVLAVILVNFGQVTALLGSFNFDWPPSLLEFFENVTFFNINLELAAPECNAEITYEQKYGLILTLPLMLLAYVWCVYAFIIMYSKARTKSRVSRDIEYTHPLLEEHEDGSKELTFPPSALEKGFGAFVKEAFKYGFSPLGQHIMYDETIRVTVVILSTCYIFLSTKSVEIYACIEDPANGVDVMVADPTIECGSERWKRVIAPSILATLFYTVGIPVVFFIILIRIRKDLRSDETLNRYGVLFKNYDFDSFYWAIMIFLRKVSLVLTAVLVPVGSQNIGQAALAMAFLFFFLVAHGVIRPFRSRGADVMEMLTLSINFFTAIAGVCFQVIDDDELEEQLGTFIIIIIIVGFVAIVFTVVYDVKYTSAYNKATTAPPGEGEELFPSSIRSLLKRADKLMPDRHFDLVEFLKLATDDERESFADMLTILEWSFLHRSK